MKHSVMKDKPLFAIGGKWQAASGKLSSSRVPATRHLPPATCHLPPATCHLLLSYWPLMDHYSPIPATIPSINWLGILNPDMEIAGGCGCCHTGGSRMKRVIGPWAVIVV